MASWTVCSPQVLTSATRTTRCADDCATTSKAADREAESALRVDQSLRASGGGESRVHMFSTLGVQRLLFTLRQESPGTLRDFEESVIGPVIAYDRKHGTELLQTLKTYIECDGNINEVAEFLHVHKYTVRYRLRRVTELTGLDVTGLRDAVQAAGLL